MPRTPNEPMQSYYRNLFNQFGESGDAVCCGFTFLTLLGPFLIFCAALVSAGMLGGSGSSSLVAYNNAVSAWTNVGYDSFTTLFPPNNTVTVNVTMGGTDKAIVAPISVELAPETHVIGGDMSGASTYSDAIYFQGEFDLWADGWPGPDQYVQFSVAGIPEPVTILAFLCTNYVAKVPCGSVPPAPSDSAPTARRSLLRSSKGPAPAPSCTGYFRQVTVLSSVSLLAQPPKYLNGNWSLNVFHCDEYPWVSTEQVSEATYNEDVSKLPWPGANPAWCLSWQDNFAARPNVSTMTFRSSTDPYIVEGQTTNCTWSTNAAGVRQAEDAEARVLLMPGFGILCFSGIVLAILVGRYNRAEDRAATSRKFGLGTEATPLATRKVEEEPPYGATEGTKPGNFKRVLSTAD